jgi:cytochrome subunit of sulfide dehydrogenase
MKNYFSCFLDSLWFLVYVLIASTALFNISNAAEVLVSTDTLSNTPHIRTLAASCAACHGSNGNSTGITPSLASLDDGYFITQMLAFRDGSRPASVMHHHAKGLNIDEINLLANYFLTQKRVTNNSPKPQALKANHE